MRSAAQSLRLARSPDPKIRALDFLDRTLAATGDTWVACNGVPIPGAQHATVGDDLHASTEIGVAECYLANWSRRRIEETVKPVSLVSSGLSEMQNDAATLMLRSKVGVLTGLPGSGKTFTARAVVESVIKAGGTVLGCAFTGAASSRLGDMTGIQCQTIHRLLGYNGKVFRVDVVNADMVLVDEASMLAPQLALALCSRLGPKCRLVIMGDPNQLPPVDPGDFLVNMMSVAPHAHLTEIHRQGKDSPISLAAAQVLRGEIPEPIPVPPNEGFLVLQCPRLECQPGHRIRNHPLQIAERFAQLRGVRINQLRVFASSNSAVDAINASFEVCRADKLAPTPKLITANFADKEVFNGDVGELFGVRGGATCIRFSDGRREYIPSSCVRDGWCTTVHKSQGREFDSAIMWVESCTTRRALYTAITRAKKLFAIVGDTGKVAQAVTRDEPKRFSLFRQFYTGEAQLVPTY